MDRADQPPSPKFPPDERPRGVDDGYPPGPASDADVVDIQTQVIEFEFDCSTQPDLICDPVSDRVTDCARLCMLGTAISYTIVRDFERRTHRAGVDVGSE